MTRVSGEATLIPRLVVGPCARYAHLPLSIHHLTPQHSRLRAVHSTRASILFPARSVRSLQLSVFSQVAMVAHRRLYLLFLRRSAQIMDHSNAAHNRLHDALYFGKRREIIRACSFTTSVLFCFKLNLVSRQTTYTNSRSYSLPLSCSPQRKVCIFAPHDQLVNVPP